MHHPDYMNYPTGGPFEDSIPGQSNLVQASLPLGVQHSPKEIERMKAEAQKAHRSSELTEIARNLEYLRARLIMIDVQVEAQIIDNLIHALITRWDNERSQ